MQNFENIKFNNCVSRHYRSLYVELYWVKIDHNIEDKIFIWVLNGFLFKWGGNAFRLPIVSTQWERVMIPRKKLLSFFHLQPRFLFSEFL